MRCLKGNKKIVINWTPHTYQLNQILNCVSTQSRMRFCPTPSGLPQDYPVCTNLNVTHITAHTESKYSSATQINDVSLISNHRLCIGDCIGVPPQLTNSKDSAASEYSSVVVILLSSSSVRYQ